MSAEVIELADHRPRGNGARETLQRLLGDDAFVELLLLSLWSEGYKVVRLEPGDMPT